MARAGCTAALLLAIWPACRDVAIVGSVQCGAAADCSPAASICGPDGRCVPGCVANASQCVAGSTCNAATGECAGGDIVGMSCANDRACDPPDIVCRPSTSSCVAGCTLSGPCPSGLICDLKTGHCCDPDDDPSCPVAVTTVERCNTDAECGAPARICTAGRCVPGCTEAGCAAPLACDAATGRCASSGCARDADCDAGSYCTQGGRCEVLAFGGDVICAGGTPVIYRCAVEETAAEFRACVGGPGPSACPYCLGQSCFYPNLCSSSADCHRGDACERGLCRVQPVECPSTVPIAAVAAGTFAAGKEVCVHDRVTAVRKGYDGMIEIRLGTGSFLFVDVASMYKVVGVPIPTVGDEVTVHGTVRWDAGHSDWELLPVDWIGP